MHFINDHLRFSATDLSNYLACKHLSLLDRQAVVDGTPRPVLNDPMVEVLRERGLEHERMVLESLVNEHGEDTVIQIGVTTEDSVNDRGGNGVKRTIQEMRSGRPVIYQGSLGNDLWYGRPDFLIRVEKPSKLGAWSYEVIDAKLARTAKGGALLQLLLYADLLREIQGEMPEHVYLALAGPDARREQFRVVEYAAYFRTIRDRFEAEMQTVSEVPPFAPDPEAHCDLCSWYIRCNQERRDVDHLAFVAGISRLQRAHLMQNGIATLEALATHDIVATPTIGELHGEPLLRIREQARIQAEGRREARHHYELLPLKGSAGYEDSAMKGLGLAALPEPSEGDIFFDIEGDPYALKHGLEYLFGFVDAKGDFQSLWALSRDHEKQAFEEFIDFVTERIAHFPDMHIYHYAPYEPSALKRLMGLHGTREEEVDRLLRGEVFVDLYRVVRQGIRASVESYSIKQLEPFYGYERTVELKTANHALANFQAWLELGGDGEEQKQLLSQIEGYNRDDCISTLRLRNWLESLRVELAIEIGQEVPRPAPGNPESSDQKQERDEEVSMMVEKLTDGIPADEETRTPEQHGRWLLAQILGFHQREKKALWWEHFRVLSLAPDEEVEDKGVLGGLEYVDEVGQEKKSTIYRYRYPQQEHGIEKGAAVKNTVDGKNAGTVVALDEEQRTVDLKRSTSRDAVNVTGIFTQTVISDTKLRKSIQRIAREVIDVGSLDKSRYLSVADLLLRRTPRTTQSKSESLIRSGEDTLDTARRLVHVLDQTVLPIQGPPGAGKTFTGARMIVAAIRAGKRVGVTAMGHKAITNLMNAVCDAANDEDIKFAGLQKGTHEQVCDRDQIECATSNEQVATALTNGEIHLAAGTAWLWSREEMEGVVDILFIDEAGQFSLANTVAVAPAATNLVLLGDQQQLNQPIQGSHPVGSDASALGHLLNGASTISIEKGIFLAKTWRLHTSICQFTSEIFYGGRLTSTRGTENQHISSNSELPDAGLCFIPVVHEGNHNVSDEEAEKVGQLVKKLISSASTWTDEKEKTRQLTIDDILVVAPYNAHVSALLERLPDGAIVGTVDKFQGQEAPIAIYSMATSTIQEAPRGMSFLFSPYRFNVATSRAKAVAVVVANPSLFGPDCRTPEDMRLANAFCRFREMANEQKRLRAYLE